MFKTRVALFWLATETKSVIPKQNMMLKAGNSQLDCKDFQKKKLKLQSQFYRIPKENRLKMTKTASMIRNVVLAKWTISLTSSP